MRARLVSLLATLACSTACARVRDVPLPTGSFESTSEPRVRLELDPAANRLVLAQDGASVELGLLRIEDRRQWFPDCGTHTGHARMEVARLRPTSFVLGGQTRRFDTVRSTCGAGVELVDEAGSTTWGFRAAAARGP